MIKPCRSLIVLCAAVLFAQPTRSFAETKTASSAHEITERMLKLPLRFEPTADGRFLSRTGRNTIAIGKNGSVQFMAPGQAPLEMSLVGANASSPAGEAALRGHSNYFLGNDSTKWQHQVPQFGKTRVAAVYPGIDLVYYGNGSELEHDYIVEPGADAGKIRLTFEHGAARLESGSGDLLLQPETGEPIRMRQPVAYQQDAAGVRQIVAAAYRRDASGEVAFELGAYDHGRELVIDPVILYSTYFGGSNYDSVVDVKTDSTGDIVFLMNTTSTNLITFGSPSGICNGVCGVNNTAGPYYNGGSASEGTDLYVAKMDALGQTLDWATYIGGSGADTAATLALDADGNVYIAGMSASSDFPTMNAYATAANINSSSYPSVPQSGVLVKLSQNGSSLLYSTYIGWGFAPNYVNAGSTNHMMALDKNGIAYVLGASSNSPSIPFTQTKNPLYHEGPDFIAKFDTTQSGNASLVYSTMIGDDSNTSQVVGVISIGVDSQSDLWILGESTSSTFPVISSDAYQTSCGSSGCASTFVMELNPGGTAETYGTWLTGTVLNASASEMSPVDMSLDSADDIYVSGYTGYSTYPMMNEAFGPTGDFSNGGNYLTKLAPGGKTLLYSTYTYAGGMVDATAAGLAVQGGLSGTGFITKNGLPTPTLGFEKYDGVFTEYDTTQSGAASIVVASYLGSSTGITTVNRAIFDANGKFLVLGGITSATDLPVVSPLQATCNTTNCTFPTISYDGFLMRIQPSTGFSISPTTITFPSTSLGVTSAAMTAVITNGSAQQIDLSTGSLTDSTDFTETDSCNGAVPSGQSCTVTFTFKPQSTGTLTSTYQISQTNGTSDPLQVALTGTATASPVQLSPATISFGTVAVGATSTQTATLTNSASSPYTIGGVSVAGTGFTITQSQCGSSLAAQTSCQITLALTPTTAGALTGTLTVVVAGTTQTVQLTATAVSGSETLTPAAINFGTLTDGTIGTQVVTFTNAGSQTVTITGTTLTPPIFTLAGTTCGTTVPAAGTCTYTLQYQPSGFGTATGSFTVADGSSNPTATVTGTGVQGSTGSVTMTPTALSFPNTITGQPSAEKYIRLVNSSAASIQIAYSDITLADTGAAEFSFTFESDVCALTAGCTIANPGTSTETITLAPGIGITLAVTMNGTGTADESYTANLSAYWTAVGDPSMLKNLLVSSLAGNLLSPAAPYATPTAIEFPITANGKKSAAQTVTVGNNGDTAVGLAAIAVSGDTTGAFAQTNNCPTTLNKGDQCTVSLTFTPGTTGQDFTATLNVPFSTNTTQIALTGYTTAQDFTVTSSSGTQSGSAASWTIAVGPRLTGVAWTQPVTFTVSGLDPSYGTPVFTPATVTPGDATVTTVMTLKAATTTAAAESRRPHLGLRTGWPILACFVVFLPFGRRLKYARAAKILLIIACVALAGLVLPGCGVSNVVTFTVTATSGSVSHTVDLQYQP